MGRVLTQGVGPAQPPRAPRAPRKVEPDGVLAPREELPPGAELWIGSGRQHQVYVRRTPDGVLRLAPRIWSTLGKRWLSMDLYQRGEPDMAVAGCFNCHLSAVGYERTVRGMAPGWSELPVGCESCHGPGLDHVRARRAGELDDYGSTEHLGAAEEARLCGRCHGNRQDLRESARGPAAGAVTGLRAFHRTLADPFLRADGTQRLTGYQLGGHLMSACHRVGKVQCRHCHHPHSGRPRALDGSPAEGAASDRQCAVCHRDRLDPDAARAHAKHPAKELRCIDCHMAPSWIGDTPERDQRTADHSISVPRPLESADLALPNACATCHEGRRGGRAGERRDWVVAVARGRRGWPDAAGPLRQLLDDPTAGEFGHASALELMTRLSRTPDLADALQRGGWADHRDPLVRAHALAALSVHAGDGAGPWIRRALDDPHPVVRLLTFARAQTSQLTESDLDRHLSDSLQWRQRPKQEDLLRLAQVRLAKAQFEQATHLLDLAYELGSPDERRRPELEALRERAKRMADGGVGDRPWAQ